MEAIQELYNDTCGRLYKMIAERDRDIERIRDAETDFWRRTHYIELRRARYILEASDLELSRHMLLRELALSEMRKANPIIVMGGV